MAYIQRNRKVSIVMGVYNCSQTISEAIDSLIIQTFKDWELIICDDGSTDFTAEIVRSYAERYNNILFIKNERNLGLPATLNICIDHSQAEYIARMDGDDISLPDRLEEEVSFLDSHPEYAIVSCEMIHFDNNGDWGISRYVEKPQKTDFIKKSPFCHAGSMMRRSALNSVGNYTVNEELRRGQDYWLWHKFYRAGYKGYNIQEPLYKMRDDQAAMKRRTWGCAINGAKTEWKIFTNLGLPYIYRFKAFRGLLVALLPSFIYSYLHKRKQKA